MCKWFIIFYPDLASFMANVPNYQGIFLRGHGSQKSSHYGVVTHASGNLGELQGDTIRNITAKMWTNSRGPQHLFLDDSSKLTSGAFTVGDKYLQWGAAEYNNASRDRQYLWEGSLSFDASKVVPIANENRPMNIAVRYLIRSR